MPKMTKEKAESILKEFQEIYAKREKVYRELYLLNKKVYEKKQEILIKKLQEFTNGRESTK